MDFGVEAAFIFNKLLKVHNNVCFSMFSEGGGSRVQKTGSHPETLSNDPHRW